MTEQPDYRSICLIAEPIFGPEVTWRVMGFVGGQLVSNIVGTDRAVVLDDALCAIAAAGVDLDPQSDDAPERRQPQWCPVCKTNHEHVGEMTDAGLVTRPCPNVPTDDPRYYGSPVYTGTRGTHA